LASFLVRTGSEIFALNRVMKYLVWCGGRDSNPRRPTPRDLKWRNTMRERPRSPPHHHNSPLRLKLMRGELEKFEKWLRNRRRISENTIQKYLSYTRKLPEIITPEKALDLLAKPKYLILSLRLFIQFMEEMGYIDESEALRWLKLLKASRPSRPDIREVKEEEVREALKVIKERGRRDIELAYLIMLFSGCRLSEAVELMNSFKPERVHVVNSEYSRYALMFERGAKKALWLYLPNWLISRLREEKYALSRRAVTDFARRYGILAPKYLRKFFYQKALDLGLDRETIDFMQGRVSGLSIGARHYDSLLRRADKEYEKVFEELGKFYLYRTLYS